MSMGAKAVQSERFGVRHRAAPLVTDRGSLAPILSTVLTQPYQNRRPPLDGVPHLGLLFQSDQPPSI